MKWIAGVIGVLAIFTLINVAHREAMLAEIKDIQNSSNQSLIDMQKISEKNMEKANYERWAAEKTKILVRAREAKDCMNRLNLHVLNNEVIECNKDHYVEVRNDDLAMFKQKEGLE